MAGKDEFKRPIVTVDIVLLTVADGGLAVALQKREAEPFRHAPALPGGFVHTDEDGSLDDAVRRILLAKVGLGGIFFEQLASFAGPARDPRGWSVSIAYFALVPREELGETASGLTLHAVDSLPVLPFDHMEIVRAALMRLRGKGAYSTIPARLLPPVFTMGELLATYETVLGARLDQSAFRRKMSDLDLLEEVEGEKRQTERAKRPATLYRLKTPMRVFDRRV
ncbi:MAG: NUDIX hydrolase [Mesorhizobium amorphae]|nr:MAG: NUDIX hydrolase [Mesorhizobium amorphae]